MAFFYRWVIPMAPQLVFSRRVRSTPFTSRVLVGGAQAFTVYNHMLLASTFRSLEADYWHLDEHVQVWDVSCERQVQIKGPDANRLVQLMTPRDLSRAKPGLCFYVPLCDESGGMVNDPIAIAVDDETWWLSIADSDVLLWAKGLASGFGLDVEICEPDVWPVAVQGPKAEELMARVFGESVRDIRFFHFAPLSYRGHSFIVARSGWSKRGGFEIYVDDAELGVALWDELFARGADLNVGHGCPNQIERMESGLLSFGSDMDLGSTPLQCGLDKYCDLDRDIDSLSVAALRAQRAAGVQSRLMGVVIPGRGQAVAGVELTMDGQIVGDIRSQVVSAKYDAWLGFAMIDSAAIAACEAGASIVTDDGASIELRELPFDLTTLPLRQ